MTTVTLNEVVLESAMRSGAGFEGTCTGAGTTTTLVDLAATDQGTDANFAAGGWIYRPDAALAADMVRRISSSGFDPSTGTWTVTRAWTNAPTNSEAYQVYAMLPPIEQRGMAESWRRLVNRGLGNMWFEDEITIGTGDGSRTRFLMSDDTGWTPTEQQITAVLARRTDSGGLVYDMDQSKGGRSWAVLKSGGDAYMVLLRPPTSEQQVVLQVIRTYPSLTADTDTTVCPLELASLRTRFELMSYLDATPQSQGQYTGELARAYKDWAVQYAQTKPNPGITFR